MKRGKNEVTVWNMNKTCTITQITSACCGGDING